MEFSAAIACKTWLQEIVSWALGAVQAIGVGLVVASIPAFLHVTDAATDASPMRSRHCSDEAPRITSMASAFLAYANAQKDQ
jgi:hypothetical protein